MRVLVSFVSFLFFALNLIPKNQGDSLGLSMTRFTQPLSFFDEKNFYKGVSKAAETPTPHFEYPVSGSVIPHHTSLGYMIANFFKNLALQNPETIILVGPNHRSLGSTKASSSSYDWETPFGILEANRETINWLAKKNLIKTEGDSLIGEQSIATLVPYIKYYLPRVKLVPIILKSSFEEKETKNLAESLSPLLNEKVVMLASVDFSHYLTRQEAFEKDKLTLAAIRNFEPEKLFPLNSDYLDSPPAMATLLFTMQKVDAKTITLTSYTNFAATSCLVLTFHRTDDKIRR